MFLSFLVLGVVGQSFLGEALLAPAPIRAGDLSQIVKTLGSLVESIDKEQDTASKLATKRKIACGQEERRLTAAIQQSKHALEDAEQDRKLALAQADEAEEDLKAAKLKVSTVSEEIDSLTSQLKDERTEAGELSEKAGASMMEIQAAIKQVQLQDQKSKHKHEAKRAAALRSSMSDLDILSSGLSVNRKAAASDQLEMNTVSFLQSASQNALGKRRGVRVDQRSIATLNSEMQQLEELEVGVMKDFDKKEGDLIDLIHDKHNAMARHEASLGDAETANADKRWRFAEADRKSTAVNNTLLRDTKLLARLQQKCNLVATNQMALRKLRLQLSNLYEMPQKILKSVDTTFLIVKDSQSQSFVQLASRVRHTDSTRSLTDIMRAALTDGTTTASSSSTAPEQEDKSSSTSGSAAAGAPFDKVTQMIQALIDSMMDQATKETKQHQWCVDSQAASKNERLKAKSDIATASASISELRITIEQVKLSQEFDESELKRIAKAKSVAEEEFKLEGKRLVAERKEHETSKQIVTKVALILNELCDLANTKTGQCADSAKLLAQALHKIDELDQASFIYLKAFGEQTQSFVSESDAAMRDAAGNHQKATGSLAQLALSLSNKKSDKKTKTKQLALLEKADVELQKGCGDHALSDREERAQHREEEIAALRRALSSLDGM